MIRVGVLLLTFRNSGNVPKGYTGIHLDLFQGIIIALCTRISANPSDSKENPGRTIMYNALAVCQSLSAQQRGDDRENLPVTAPSPPIYLQRAR